MGYSSIISLVAILACYPVYIESRQHLRGLKNVEELRENVQDIVEIMDVIKENIVIEDQEAVEEIITENSVGEINQNVEHGAAMIEAQEEIVLGPASSVARESNQADKEEAMLISSFVEGEKMISQMKMEINEMEETIQLEPFREDTGMKETIGNLKEAVTEAEAAIVEAEEEAFAGSEEESAVQEDGEEEDMIANFIKAEELVSRMKVEIEVIEADIQLESFPEGSYKTQLVSSLKEAVANAEAVIMTAEMEAFDLELEVLDDDEYDDDEYDDDEYDDDEYDDDDSQGIDDDDYDDDEYDDDDDVELSLEDSKKEDVMIADFVAAEETVANLKAELESIKEDINENSSIGPKQKLDLIRDAEETIDTMEGSLLQLEGEAFYSMDEPEEDLNKDELDE